jgi:hypothetical protein
MGQAKQGEERVARGGGAMREELLEARRMLRREP